eukprot:4651099-Pyramimonas_sp.AAC.1
MRSGDARGLGGARVGVMGYICQVFGTGGPVNGSNTMSSVDRSGGAEVLCLRHTGGCSCSGSTR